MLRIFAIIAMCTFFTIVLGMSVYKMTLNSLVSNTASIETIYEQSLFSYVNVENTATMFKNDSLGMWYYDYYLRNMDDKVSAYTQAKYYDITIGRYVNYMKEIHNLYDTFQFISDAVIRNDSINSNLNKFDPLVHKFMNNPDFITLKNNY